MEEHEKKYFLKNDDWKKEVVDEEHIRQGYIFREDKGILRIRLIDNKKKAYLAIKTKRIKDKNKEYEYEIPYEEGLEIFSTFNLNYIKKIRYIVYFDNVKYEIDNFINVNKENIAEIENPKDNFKKPNWLGKLIEDDSFINSNMIP